MNDDNKPVLRWTIGAILTVAGLMLLIPGILVIIGWGLAFFFPMAFDLLIYNVFKLWAWFLGYTVSSSSSDFFSHNYHF